MTLPPWVEDLGEKHRLVLTRMHDAEDRASDYRVPWELAVRHPDEEAAAEDLLRRDLLSEPNLSILQLTEVGRAAAEWLRKDAERRVVTTPSCPACGLRAVPADISLGGLRATCRNRHCRGDSYFTTEETIVTSKVSA